MAVATIQPETLHFPPSSWVPNHPSLPVLVYPKALSQAHGDLASEFERLFLSAGWQGIWRNGVFGYQHYHVGAHEALGIANGTAELLIGGPGGADLRVHAGDCLVLPAGTGHMCLSHSTDFLVVGSYPSGQHADIQTGAATARDRETIASLPIPTTDPIYGSKGPLTDLWTSRRGLD